MQMLGKRPQNENGNGDAADAEEAEISSAAADIPF